MEFPELWEQIKAHEGQVFYTVRGKELRYTCLLYTSDAADEL